MNTAAHACRVLRSRGSYASAVIVGLGAFVILTISLLSHAWVEFSSPSKPANPLSHAHRIGDRAVEGHTRTVDSLERWLQAVATLLTDLPPSVANDPEVLNVLLRNCLFLEEDYVSIAYVDPAYRTIAATGALEDHMMLGVRRAHESGRFAVSALRTDGATRQTTIAGAIALRDDEGRIVGLLTGQMEMDWPGELLADVAAPEGTLILVANEHGGVIAGWPHDAPSHGSVRVRGPTSAEPVEPDVVTFADGVRRHMVTRTLAHAAAPPLVLAVASPLTDSTPWSPGFPFAMLFTVILPSALLGGAVMLAWRAPATVGLTRSRARDQRGTPPGTRTSSTLNVVPTEVEDGSTTDVVRRLGLGLETETRRLAEYLHDEVGPLVTLAYNEVGSIAQRLPPPHRDELLRACRHLDAIEGNMRDIAHELHPRILEYKGLGPAVAFLARSIGMRKGIAVDIEVPDLRPHDPLIEATLYRTIQEVLSNAARHAGARHITLSLREDSTALHAEVHDDGCGFDARAALAPGGSTGLGLRAIRERLDVVAGDLNIDSSPGSGTSVRIRIPVDACPASSRAASGGAARRADCPR